MVKKFLDFIFESNDHSIEFDVHNIDGDIIDELVDKFSFIYKKVKDRYLRPIKIEGKNIDGNTKVEIFLSNDDTIKIKHYSADNELLVYINDKLIYHMDGIEIDEIVNKSAKIYEKHLKESNFKINKKNNPFTQ